MELPTYLTVEQVAEVLQLSRDTVYRLLASGDLRGVKFGKCWRVRIEDVTSTPETLKDQATSRNLNWKEVAHGLVRETREG